MKGLNTWAMQCSTAALIKLFNLTAYTQKSDQYQIFPAASYYITQYEEPGFW